MSTGSSAEKRPQRATTTDAGGAKRPLAVKLAWFAGLWLAGLAVTAGLAYALRALLFSG